mmetsp:Transcript_22285/g.56493  ORF Transcript_22285/g.56493 Transcript_22285/m.56493 type:complete len:269 (+) Transcript_22285:379-1185(+)
MGAHATVSSARGAGRSLPITASRLRTRTSACSTCRRGRCSSTCVCPRRAPVSSTRARWVHSPVRSSASSRGSTSSADTHCRPSRVCRSCARATTQPTGTSSACAGRGPTSGEWSLRRPSRARARSGRSWPSPRTRQAAATTWSAGSASKATVPAAGRAWFCARARCPTRWSCSSGTTSPSCALAKAARSCRTLGLKAARPRPRPSSSLWTPLSRAATRTRRARGSGCKAGTAASPPAGKLTCARTRGSRAPGCSARRWSLAPSSTGAW